MRPTMTTGDMVASDRQLTRLLLVLFAFVTLLSGCDKDRSRPISGNDASDSDTVPLVGGSCTYEDVAFPAAVDSVLAGRGLLIVEALDSVATEPNLCGSVAEGVGIRWIVPPPASGPEVRVGDVLDVEGQVLVTGTCTPCSLRSRHVQGR
ncbi:MAG: hypothetical protein PVF19_06770 [Gemmatimonadota bacterium]